MTIKTIQLSKAHRTIKDALNLSDTAWNEWYNKHKIIHIGVEHLHSVPITENPSFGNDNKMSSFSWASDQQNNYINACDILEYGDLDEAFTNMSSPTMPFNDDVSFLTITYEETS